MGLNGEPLDSSALDMVAAWEWVGVAEVWSGHADVFTARAAAGLAWDVIVWVEAAAGIFAAVVAVDAVTAAI